MSASFDSRSRKEKIVINSANRFKKVEGRYNQDVYNNAVKFNNFKKIKHSKMPFRFKMRQETCNTMF